MAEIGKGMVTQIKDGDAMIRDPETGSIKKSIMIPQKITELEPGDTVCYVYFNDMTGLIIDILQKGGDG